MEKLTSNKSAADMSMIELAHNCCFADSDRNARYRDYGLDIDARELVKMLMKDICDDDLSNMRDEEFDEYMGGMLSVGIDSPVGLIALFYRNLWAMADLRENLKSYEDLGYTPEELELLFNLPSVLYIIGEECDDERINPIYPVDGEQVEFCNGEAYWNCRDGFGDCIELPLCGLHKDYFLTIEEAEKQLK